MDNKSCTASESGSSHAPFDLSETGGLLDYIQDADWPLENDDGLYGYSLPGFGSNDQAKHADTGLNREKALIEAIDGPSAPTRMGSDAEMEQLSKRMGSLRVAEDGQL